MKFADYEMQKALADFGKIPKHQVKFIWDMAYHVGHKEGRSGAFDEMHRRQQREAVASVKESAGEENNAAR
jgi:hypothetical protein